MTDELTRRPNGTFGPGGRSPNPKGRPKKKISSIDEMVLDVSSERITSLENGTIRKISKAKANFKQIANQGAAGDRIAGKVMLDITRGAESRRAASEAAAAPILLGPSDEEVVGRVIARLRRIIMQEASDADTDD